MNVFVNGRRYSCLACPTSSPSCPSERHPLQCQISYEELLGKYARKVDRDRHDAIGIYTCPYCAAERLTIASLFDHARDDHPAPPMDQPQLPPVYCPVCVCFLLENCTDYLPNPGGLAEHMLSRHCFASAHQYRDEYKVRTDFCCDDEFEIIRFLAIFVPPSNIAIRSAPADDQQSNLNAVPSHQPLVCPICLEEGININEGKWKPLEPCEHKFHIACIDRWMDQKKCCPVCRSDCS